MKKLTMKTAKELSIKKWEFIVASDGRLDYDKLLEVIPELKELTCHSRCAFCEYYYVERHGDCEKCPLGKVVKEDHDVSDALCQFKGQPYSKWEYNKTRKNAQAVLDQIKNS